MSRAGVGRRVRRTILALGAVALLFALAYWLVRPRLEVAEGLVPDPVEPFGPVTRGEIVFRWAIPSDRVPVRVEIFDASATGPALWESEPVGSGTLRPVKAIAERWPATDLLWRPVALPPREVARPGPLAAFTLLP